MKLHLRRSTPGEGWSHMQLKDVGPDVRKRYEPPRNKEPEPQDEPRCRKSDKDTAFLCEEPQQQEGAGRSPLAGELLARGENVTELLNYEEDPEVMAAITNIPRVDDVEMKDINAPPGFDPRTVPKYRSTSVYTSSYIKHRTVQCERQTQTDTHTLTHSPVSWAQDSGPTSRKSQSIKLEHVAH